MSWQRLAAQVSSHLSSGSCARCTMPVGTGAILIRYAKLSRLQASWRQYLFSLFCFPSDSRSFPPHALFATLAQFANHVGDLYGSHQGRSIIANKNDNQGNRRALGLGCAHDRQVPGALRAHRYCARHHPPARHMLCRPPCRAATELCLFFRLVFMHSRTASGSSSSMIALASGPIRSTRAGLSLPQAFGLHLISPALTERRTISSVGLSVSTLVRRRRNCFP